MARCNDCNKFVSYDEDAEPEVDSADVTGDELTVEVRRILNCSECSTELKSASFTIEVNLGEQEVQPPATANESWTPCEDGHEWEGEDDLTVENNDRRETTKEKMLKSGKKVIKPIKFRFQRMYYGVHVSGDLTCAKCQGHVSIDTGDECQASGLDDSQ